MSATDNPSNQSDRVAVDPAATRCGHVAIVGRPNVGKSTLLNQLVGQKLSITAHKPQTTRHAIHGVSTKGPVQAIYCDTPGIHLHGKRVLNQVLNRTASTALHDVDVIVMVVQAMTWQEDDQRVLDLVLASGAPFYLFVNKVDRVKRKEDLLPFLANLAGTDAARAVIPGSARSGQAVTDLETAVFDLLPLAAHEFDADDLTDRSSRFLASEMVREQVTRLLANELPYSISVDVEQFVEDPDLIRIGAVIWVEKASQKGIVIGKGGERLKMIGTRSRQSIEKLFGQKVFLQLWVRVKEGWFDDERALRSLGYEGHDSGS